jgi:zinc transporter ZupT
LFSGLSGALFVIFLKDISPDLVLRCIVPFTIGAFIYVSLTNVLPELMEDQK